MSRVMIFLIKIWQLFRPVRHQLLITVFGTSSVCRQKVSCSDFAINQIQRHGTILGLKKSIARIMSCHNSSV